MSKRNLTATTAIGIVLFALCLLSLRFGSTRIAWNDFFGALFSREGSTAVIIYNLRLPRLLGGLVAGCGLALSGLILQSITDNGMASPNLVGVSSGAGFAVILTLSVAAIPTAFLPVAAFVGAFLATVVIVSISSHLVMGKGSVVLVGLAFSSVLSAGISFLSLLDRDVLADYNSFSIGTLSGVELGDIAVPSVIVAVAFVVLRMIAGRINLLFVGDSAATALGVNVKGLRTVCMLLASALAASAVSFVGLLGFVGLMAPHIARLLFGADTRRLVMPTALIGALLVTASDLLGRLLFAPSELPVGIIMSLLGAPFFLGLLLWGGRKNV